MALTFLPASTPSTVGILVLTLDKYLQSEIETALHEYQCIFFASNANEASSILAEDQIGVVVIDVSTLESDDRDLISEMLSFFPELVLVSFLEAGSTHNLVALSEKYDVYRYLKIPCARKQIASCVNSAVKKYLKQHGSKDEEDKDNASLPPFLHKKNIAIISVVAITILLSLIFYISRPTAVSEQKQQLIAEIQPGKSGNNNLEAEKPVLEISATVTKIEQILAKANDAIKAEHIYKPEGNNALNYYVNALHIEPENQEALTGLKIVLRLMVDNLNTSLNTGEYHSAAEISNILAATLPDSSLTEPLLKHLSDQGLVLVNQAKQHADNGEFDTAKTTLSDAAILLGDNHNEIIAAETYISSALDQPSQFNEFLEKAKLRLNNDNLTRPRGDSAKFYLLALREMSPENEIIPPLLIELADKLLRHANLAINEKNHSKAKYFLQEAKTLGVRADAISNLEEKLNSPEDTESIPAQVTQQADTIQQRIERQEKINKLLISARKSYNSGQYFEPENNNASYFLLLAKKIEPGNEDINHSLIELVEKILSMVEIKLADNLMQEASILINHAKQLDVKTDEVKKLEQEIN